MALGPSNGLARVWHCKIALAGPIPLALLAAFRMIGIMQQMNQPRRCSTRSAKRRGRQTIAPRPSVDAMASNEHTLASTQDWPRHFNRPFNGQPTSH